MCMVKRCFPTELKPLCFSTDPDFIPDVTVYKNNVKAFWFRLEVSKKEKKNSCQQARTESQIRAFSRDYSMFVTFVFKCS